MRIEVLGTGCARCNQLEKDVYNALAELGVDAEVEKVQDLQKILQYKVMMTPALVIDGKVKSAGRVPRKEELHQLIKESR
ncbi:MAG: thioredoxin family protein [Syntrophomonadaceae bacterium]|jgi:small redox-active disulfide protein 2|nr:thioredoxin family protein [Syntrophomonadaceae bacterium]